MSEFEKNTIELLTRLDTKMTIMVGPDGNGGWKADAEQRIRSLEHRRIATHGMVGVISAIVTGLLNWTFQHLGHH
jgi:succinyl-CoA synthetase alpha subunit